MYLSLEDYRRRMLGCWIGKNVGGTLGMPMEWNRQPNDVTYYTHKMTGEPLPNDDLDIQVLWLLALEDKGLDIEFVEQPVPAADLEGMQYVTRHASVPVLADESVFSPADALRIMQTGAADFVNIKLMKCGGITNALRIASAAEVYGVECMIGCMLEAKISVNAAVELACAKKIITKVDLDGPVLCSEDHILGGAVFDEKNITVSDAPGMGIQGFVPGKVTYLDD